MANLEKEHRRVIQIRVALRRMLSAASPLRKGQLFDNPAKQYPEWQRRAINRLIESDVLEAEGEGYRRTYKLHWNIDRHKLRRDLEDDMWISGMIWPNQDFVLVEKGDVPQPEPIIANTIETPTSDGDTNDRQILETLLQLFGLVVDKLDRVEKRGIECERILKRLEAIL